MKPPARPPRLAPQRPGAPPRPAGATPARPGRAAAGAPVLQELADLDTVPDPLADLSGEGSPEEIATAEVTAMQQAFRDRSRTEMQRFERETDSEHWFAVTFDTREQKDAFLAFLGWTEEGNKYLDGRALAQRISCPLPDGQRSFNIGKVDKALQKLR